MKKRKKQTKADFNRTFGIPPEHKLRWVGLTGVAWYFLSILRRNEDAKKYGKCVSCEAKLDWDQGDGGHFISVSRSPGMKLQEDNVYLQCKRCNNPSWVPDASIPFGAEIDRRFYPGKAKELYDQSTGYNKGPSDYMLMGIIGDLRKRIEGL